MDLETAMCAARDLFKTTGKPASIFCKGQKQANLDSQDFYASSQDLDATSDQFVVIVTQADF